MGPAPGRGEPHLTEVLRTGRSRLVTGPWEEGGSVIVVPLRARQHTLGTLSFLRGPSGPIFNDADRTMAEDLGVRSGLAMDNARLLRQARAAEAESRRNATRLRTLVEVDRLLAEAGLDLPAVLDVMARKVSEVMGDGCVLQLSREEGAFLEPVAVHHPDPEVRELLGQVHARRQKVGQGLHGGVVSSGREVVFTGVDEEALAGLPEYRPLIERHGPQSMMVVPLAVRGRVCGSLGVMRGRDGAGAYTEEDRLLLHSLAERAAMAIEDARAYGAATEAVRLRDDFLSVAGHELKTPLSALRLQIQLLARWVRSPERAAEPPSAWPRPSAAPSGWVALVDELLDAGRITAGRLKLEREETDLAVLTTRHARAPCPRPWRARATR